MENLGHLVYSREVIEFTAVANEYCRLLDDPGDMTGLKLLKIEQKLLPLLYYKTLMIPETEPVLEETGEKFVTEEDWGRVNHSILSLLGEANDFMEVFDERMNDSEGPVAGSISENLSDIYQDLRNFLVAYNIGTTEIMNDALWECMENFRLYWGQKLVNTIRAVHYALKEPEKIGTVGNRSGNNGSHKPDTSGWFISKRQDEFRNSEDE